jgi:hypothetical protein
MVSSGSGEGANGHGGILKNRVKVSSIRMPNVSSNHGTFES